jgi:hypothetical protein
LDPTIKSPASCVKPPTFSQRKEPTRFASPPTAEPPNRFRGLETDLATIAEKGGRKAIEAIPGVGASTGSAITEMLTSGRARSAPR